VGEKVCRWRYLVIPSYGDVNVVASAGGQAPVLWSLLPATDSAGGSVLLAYRQWWRDAQRPDEEGTTRLDFEMRAADIRGAGYAVNAQGNLTSLAVPVGSFRAGDWRTPITATRAGADALARITPASPGRPAQRR
jgi:hypothetical protein